MDEPGDSWMEEDGQDIVMVAEIGNEDGNRVTRKGARNKDLT